MPYSWYSQASQSQKAGYNMSNSSHPPMLSSILTDVKVRSWGHTKEPSIPHLQSLSCPGPGRRTQWGGFTVGSLQGLLLILLMCPYPQLHTTGGKKSDDYEDFSSGAQSSFRWKGILDTQKKMRVLYILQTLVSWDHNIYIVCTIAVMCINKGTLACLSLAKLAEPVIHPVRLF